MREIRLLRGRLARKGGGLTGMHTVSKCNIKSTKIKDILKHAEAISSKHKITKHFWKFPIWNSCADEKC
jgi:hypothetical protein